MSAPKQGDIIIAVMGVTGAGKSTFIANVTGQDVQVGNTMDSCTTEPEIFETTLNDKKVFFIDTPGFDDSSGLDDADILQMTAEKLQAVSEANLMLTSILFLHKITDNRLTGSSKRLQRVYEKVCGHEAFSSVVLGTTMWDDLGKESKGVAREKQLREGDFWGKMIRGGTECYRLKDSSSSAQDLAMMLMDKKPAVMQMQSELIYNGGALIQTAAGQELNGIYVDQIRKQERKAALDESERAELERLREAEKKTRETIIVTQPYYVYKFCTIL
ncbi:P-loop containing nucleoside triphosphate hydrolase protein [Rhexocercosporidium sp. MPI-PUGE-AT-0058]|nr:P-loop containing nucleoside triphosphate hydrolase protein [Rhexocercosporidium sp. MPI-PUGE-AT-0058]